MNDSSFFVPASEVVARLGSQSALAALLGIAQQSVSAWCLKGKPIPPQHVLKVEAATGIRKEDLRPDIYPPDAASAPTGGVAGPGAGGDTPPSRAPSGAAGAERTPDSLSGLTA